MKKTKKQFTLVELLVVIAIIGTLAALITVSLSGGVFASQRAKVKADMARFTTAAIDYVTNENYTPADGDTLSLTNKLGFKAEECKDPWNVTYPDPKYNADFERWEMTVNTGDAAHQDTADKAEKIYSWKN